MRMIPEFKTFDPVRETLTMMKPIYGLKDAPRAWRRKLDQVLLAFGARPLYADGQVYVCHRTEDRGKNPNTQRLEMILSTHVDDLKGASTRPVALKLLSHIERAVGACTKEWNKFVHVGIEHEQTKDGIYCHQETYAAQLRPIDSKLWSGMDTEALANETLSSLYLSLLGGAAWMILTRPDMSVYVQA